MNILILSTDDFLGAGRASIRVAKSLEAAGHNCKLVVKNKSLSESIVADVHTNYLNKFFKKIKVLLKNLKWRKIKLNPNYYFFGYKTDSFKVSEILDAAGFQPDIIIVTWVSDFLDPQIIHQLQVKTNAKVIVYPLDMSLYTGGCHYAWDCDGYTKECKNCPAIITPHYKDYSHHILNEKKKYFNKSDVKVIAATNGLYEEAFQSTLFRNQRFIPKVLIPIDNKVFNANCRSFAKVIFKINPDSFTILFGASFSYEKRKGVEYFLESLQLLNEKLTRQEAKKVQIIIVGHHNNSDLINKVPFKTITLNYIKDDLLLSLLYQASDVFVSSSIQDSGPMMINEATMCGTPVVAFDLGVADDLIIDGKTGYKVNVGDNTALALAISKVFLAAEAKTINNAEIADLTNQRSGINSFNKGFEIALEQL